MSLKGTNMTKQQALNLFFNLTKLNNLQGAKFTYLIARNRIILEKVRIELDKFITPTDDYVKFDEKRLELAKSFAKLDEEKKPLVIGDQFVMRDQQEFDKAYDVLKGENKEVVDQRSNQFKLYNEVLREEINPEFYKIKISDVPDNINSEQMEIITPFIEE